MQLKPLWCSGKVGGFRFLRPRVRIPLMSHLISLFFSKNNWRDLDFEDLKSRNLKRHRNFIHAKRGRWFWTMESNADRSTTCFQNFPISPCALAAPELPKTILRACWKIKRDNLARLVSSDPEDFAHYQYNGINDASLPRGNLGCLLGFPPLGRNPTGAI